jgi:hypothetical protein
VLGSPEIDGEVPATLFLGLFLAVLSRVKTAEILPVFLNFNRSSCLLRRSLVIQRRGRKLQYGSGLAGN